MKFFNSFKIKKVMMLCGLCLIATSVYWHTQGEPGQNKRLKAKLERLKSEQKGLQATQSLTAKRSIANEVARGRLFKSHSIEKDVEDNSMEEGYASKDLIENAKSNKWNKLQSKLLASFKNNDGV